MRRFSVCLIASLLIVDARGDEPRFRPALIGNGPKALINVLDTKSLVEKGQGDGLVMFSCYVPLSGNVRGCYTYRDTPGAKLLKKAVENALWSCRFIPAIYNGKRTDVLLIGTVMLAVRDGAPHLRIYLNQNHDDLVNGNDFIAPQPVADSVDWTGWRYNLAAYKADINGKNGWIELALQVDRTGNQKDFRVTIEDPPGFGLATVAKQAFAKARWIPGFRNGHPVDCTADFPLWYLTWTWWFKR